MYLQLADFAKFILPFLEAAALNLPAPEVDRFMPSGPLVHCRLASESVHSFFKISCSQFGNRQTNEPRDCEQYSSACQSAWRRRTTLTGGCCAVANSSEITVHKVIRFLSGLYRRS